MKKFCRQVGNDTLYVLVDDGVFEQFNSIIGNTLRTYVPLSKEIDLSGENCFYIVPEKRKSYYASEQSYVIYRDDENWLFGLINDLDVFHTETLKCTVIHGSCIRVNNKNILIIGERWSGKTTLTHFLMSFLDGEYMSDDCVYVKNNHFFGFGMPLPMRHYRKTKSYTPMVHNDIVLTNLFDSDGVERTLLIPQKILESVNNIDIILFPKYIPNTAGTIRSIASVELFNKLISNIRSYSNMKEMYSNVTNLLEKANAYSLEYSSSNMAYELLTNYNII